MSDWIEPTMKQWRPRQASPELRRRIFASEALSAVEAPHLRDFARWLVPALGCFLMVAATLVNSGPNGVVLPASGSLRDQEMAFSIAAHHSGVNNTPARALEWSAGASTTASAAPVAENFSKAETNSLSR